MPDHFDRNVFLNCPFDQQYEPILQAILFCCVHLGFSPRVATERMDAAESRLEKICDLIDASRWSIHDLSRCQATKSGELSRLNMPFELGIDYGRRRFGTGRIVGKRFLIMDEERYRLQKTLSDIAGFDPQHHSGDHEKAVTVVRNWLVSEAGAEREAPRKILNAYADFQEWNWERLRSLGFSDDDVRDRPAVEQIDNMREWVSLDRPPSFD